MKLMSNPLVSIIVPFYNIVEYVPYCLDSILSQETDVAYEVVCIDDGSTDGTAEALDKYAQFGAVRVFHKSNGGLSDARNCGVELSKGKYITFVDGDDVISPHYVEALCEAMGCRDNCLVMGGFKTCSFSSEVKTGRMVWPAVRGSRVISADEAFRMLAYDVIQPSAWAKLAPREFYLEIPFPLGMRYEEIRTICDYLSRADSYVFLDGEIYGYVMRAGSITWSSEVTVGQLDEYKEAAETICRGIALRGSMFESAALYQRALLYTRMHSQLPMHAIGDDEIARADACILNNLGEITPLVLRDPEAPLASKVRFSLLAKYPKLYDFLYRSYRRRVKKVG